MSEVYQLLVRLRVARDCAYEARYHRKIRGRLAQAIADTAADQYRDTERSPFSFSDLMPYQSEYEAGDDLHLLVSAPAVGVLKTIAESFRDDPELTAGSFVFDVRAATPIPADVGPPGETGTIETASGVCLTIDRDSGTDTYWSEQDHSIARFRDELLGSVQRALSEETDVDPPEVNPFDAYHHRKTYAVDVEVEPVHDITLIASKFDFDYEVRDDHHRRVLNRLLTLGLGSKRSYGFGMLQTKTSTYDVTGESAAPGVV